MAIKRLAMRVAAVLLHAIHTQRSIARAEEIERRLYRDLYDEIFRKSK